MLRSPPRSRVGHAAAYRREGAKEKGKKIRLGELAQPEEGERPPDEQEGYWTFRIKPGADFRFSDLTYGRFARESYEVFKRLRDEGAIESGVRFQLCLPAPNSAINAFFEDASEWPRVQRAYMDRLSEEIEETLETIPANDLAIQFDHAWEVVDLAMGERNFFRFWPKSTLEEKFERHVSWIEELSQTVPADSWLGYHWCYGTWGGWPMTAMADLDLCVRLSNESVGGRRGASTTCTCPWCSTRTTPSSRRSPTSTSATRRSSSG